MNKDAVAEMGQQYQVAAAEKLVPKGYKQTEVGVIPEDWAVMEIGSLITELRGGAPFKPNDFTKDGIKVLPKGGVAKGGMLKIFEKDQQFCSEEFARKFAKNTIDEKYTIVVLRDLVPSGPSIGLMVEIPVPEQFVLAQGVYGFLARSKELASYLVHYSNTDDYRRAVNEIMVGSTQVHITNGSFKSLKIPLPSTNEQTAIANALSDIDALLRELEKLIAKKQAIKTATMQQLLTGRTRLPQFANHPDGSKKGYKQSELGEIPEDWTELTIGEFAPLQRGFDLPAARRRVGKYPVVYSNGIINTHDEFQVRGPGVVTGRSGTLGKVHYVENEYWPHNTTLWVTKFRNTDSKFVYFIFNYIGFERFASGSGVPTLNRNDAHSFKVSIPILEAEQTAIATILADMDAEIQALEQRLNKTRQIKQGMMQELLTGKTRLVASQSR